MFNPPHPGEIIKELCLDPLGPSVAEVAEALGVSRKTLSSILNGRAGTSPEMAIRPRGALMQYRPMSIDDYGTIVELWMRSEGVRLRDADSREDIEKYLSRNPGLSFVAESAGKIIGTIMAGHDGKRGYIQHLSVEGSHRRCGIGRELVRRCLDALKKEGILKSHLMILVENEIAKQFWSGLGWVKRTDIRLYSYINGGGQNT
jgi:addiction module HigA family antidote